ncbi:HIT family protein [Serinicoccus sp. CUA-874]|uniref:HIT family protein n=1 Tax=Serinicoccus sp. CUA-874 TaxID=1517939 RepID=UPI0022A9EF84|nr:HIT family protein [Serinicoccus sp. CUA-874]
MSCLFCRIVAREEPAHVVLDREHVVGFLDVRPVFKGHVLLVPREHVDTLTELPDAWSSRSSPRCARSPRSCATSSGRRAPSSR